ncbi:hypothetical protein PENTCL1PPCAC_9123, partial [Pristionchus entomophagus]
MTKTYTPWAEFGFWDCWTGEKTLCCKNSAVRGDPMKRCGVTASKTCPQGRIRLMEKWIGAEIFKL